MNKNYRIYLQYLISIIILAFSIKSTVFSSDVKIYPCLQISEPITLDGLLDESAWLKAEPLIFLIPVSHDTPASPAEGKLVWENQFLYIGIKARDQDIKAKLTERDDSTYLEDVLEIFLQPESHSTLYVNFEINALGTIYDAMNDYRFDVKHRKIGNDWNCEELKPGIQIQGTLNNSEDIDENWTMEVQIPFSCMSGLFKSPPQPGVRWKFHLARYDYSVYLEKGKELSSSASLSRVDFHDYREWITMEFKGD